MNKKTMKVQEALNELSMLDKRIDSGISTLVGVGVEADNKLIHPKRSKSTPTDFANQAMADVQSITDLINYRTALRSSVIKSNGVTEVNIGDDTVTVAEAIKRKELLPDEYYLLDVLERQIQDAETKAFNHNSKLDEDLRKKEELVLGSEKERKASDESSILEAIRQTTDSKRAKVILPKVGNTDIQDYVKSKREELDYFATNIGFILTASNVLTEITVEW